MTHILTVTSSPSSQSVTTRLVQRLSTGYTDAEVTNRNVASNNLPHLDETTIGAFYTPEDQRSDEQNAAVALSDELVAEAEQADVIVIGAPMHNFGISSSLKVWLDHIARVGKTFSYTDKGPVGMLTGKKVYVITARGGKYAKGMPTYHMDHQVPYLKTVLGFVGLDDVEFIHAEGIAGGTEGVTVAENEIDQTLAELRAA